MRKVRLLSLLSVAMFTAAISIAAAPASASTVLCKKAASPCETTQKYPAGTTVGGSLSSGTKSTTVSSLATVSCSGSTLSGKTGAEAGSPIEAELTTLTFSGCTSAQASECSASSFGLPVGATIVDSGSGNGTLNLYGVNYEFTCRVLGIVTTCRYSAPTAVLTLTGGAPGTLTANKVSLKKISGSGSVCSESISWSATYDATPSPLFATTGSGSEQTAALCKENAGPCPSGSRYLPVQALQASAEDISFSMFSQKWEGCKSVVNGRTEVGGGTSVKASFGQEGSSFGFCSTPNGSCGNGKTAPTNATFTPTTGGNGTLQLKSFGFMLECKWFGAPFTCTYSNTTTSLSVTGGTPAKAVATEVPMAKAAGSSAVCPETLNWSGTYSFVQPSPVYLTS